jgi:hypothetical protein
VFFVGGIFQMDEKEKHTLLRKIAEFLGITQRRIKDVDEWSGAASNYSSTEAYCNACLINVNQEAGNTDPEDWTQANCKLPIREEGDSSDTFVRQAVFAAAGGRGITQVSKPADVSQEDWDSAVSAAANKLMQAYNEMDEEAPESVAELARQKRAISTGQIWEMIYRHFDEIYGWDYWPMDIYFDATGMPFCVIATGGKLFRYSIMIEGNEATLGEAIPVAQEFVPTARTTTTIKRQADGRWRWYSVSASSVLNRVGEIDSRELFDSFEAHALETGEYPIRQFYHLGEAFRTGQADFLARDGNLYITSGLYDETDIAEMEVKARQKEPDFWGDSIGYLPQKREMLEVAEGVTIPVYKRGINTEISTLPENQAANLFTANTEVLGVRRMALDKRQMEAFVKLFDGNEDEAEQWLNEHAEARNRAIEQDGLITRSGSDEGENGPEPQEQEIVSELSDEDIARALEQSEPIQQLVTTLEALADKLGENEQASQQRFKQITDDIITKLDARIEALEADDEAKQREWLANRPRRFNGTSTKHIIRPRVARAAEDDKEQEESYADKAAETIAAKGIPNY